MTLNGSFNVPATWPCALIPALQFMIIKRQILKVKFFGEKEINQKDRQDKDKSVNSMFAKWIFTPKCQGPMDSLNLVNKIRKTCVYHVLK